MPKFNKTIKSSMRIARWRIVKGLMRDFGLSENQARKALAHYLSTNMAYNEICDHVIYLLK